MQPTKREVARQFGRRADAYAVSPGHAGGTDLDTLLGLLEPRPAMRVLDVATGAGHTAVAVAPFVSEVVATDLAPEMIGRARQLAASHGLENVRTAVMDVEALAFPDHGFDAVTCRIAPHHFLDVERAVREIARVLRPGGRLVLEDTCAPADPTLDTFLNDVEKRRDATHVRAYTEAQWYDMLRQAGLRVVQAEISRKTHPVAAWIERSGIDAATERRVHAAFAAAPPAAVAHFAIRYDDGDGRAVSYVDDKLVVRADKPR